jgi:hypothetical protein
MLNRNPPAVRYLRPEVLRPLTRSGRAFLLRVSPELQAGLSHLFLQTALARERQLVFSSEHVIAKG